MIVLVLLLVKGAELKFHSNDEKIDFCETLNCTDSVPICGIRQEGTGFRLRLFDDECDLLKYGCKVQNEMAYGAVSMDYCDRTFISSTVDLKTVDCPDYDCSYPSDNKEVCALRKDGEGFRVRLFQNRCHLWKYNCENNSTFVASEDNICSEMKTEKKDLNDVTAKIVDGNKIEKKKDFNDVTAKIVDRNVIIVDSSMINYKDYNESIQSFFAATHVFDLPVYDAQRDMDERTRRRLVKVFGPTKVFKPWITIPKNISAIADDPEHLPTLSSCYHKCPKKCPDTYAPVCGVPGIMAREPNLLFQNHCYMDVAQCKMFWEQKSPTSISSNYIESSFLFCLGDQFNSLYRFLPLLRTLQHMGRVKSKGYYRYKLSNMKFFNNILSVKDPRLMG